MRVSRRRGAQSAQRGAADFWDCAQFSAAEEGCRPRCRPAEAVDRRSGAPSAHSCPLSPGARESSGGGGGLPEFRECEGDTQGGAWMGAITLGVSSAAVNRNASEPAISRCPCRLAPSTDESRAPRDRRTHRRAPANISSPQRFARDRLGHQRARRPRGCEYTGRPFGATLARLLTRRPRARPATARPPAAPASRSSIEPPSLSQAPRSIRRYTSPPRWSARRGAIQAGGGRAAAAASALAAAEPRNGGRPRVE